MGDFSFPTNIKQIGSIGEGVRIYIEDYACSYLQQYAEAGGYEERLAFLVGRYMVIDGQTVLFISGLVQGCHTALQKEALSFTEKSWRHAKDEIKQYFNGLDIVGWMQSQPGYGVQLNESYAIMHKKMFPREDRVLFVVDPIEKVNAFYIYDERTESLSESRGYFIYYDKNRGMHEYMLDNRITKTRVRPLPEMEEAAEPVVEEMTERRHKQIEPILTKAFGKRRERPQPKNAREDAAGSFAGVFVGQGVRRGTAAAMQNQKRVANLLVSLSAALFIICFIMGAGLIQNDGRITMMEEQLTQLNTAYRDLLLQSRDNNVPVFASQPDAVSSQADAVSATPLEGQAVLITEDGGALIAESTMPEAFKAPDDLAESAFSHADIVPVTPTAAPALSEQDPVPATYTVQAGDSLTAISVRFYGQANMIDEIMRINGLDDADKIYFGKVLRLPRRQE